MKKFILTIIIAASMMSLKAQDPEMVLKSRLLGDPDVSEWTVPEEASIMTYRTMGIFKNPITNKSEFASIAIDLLNYSDGLQTHITADIIRDEFVPLAIGNSIIIDDLETGETLAYKISKGYGHYTFVETSYLDSLSDWVDLLMTRHELRCIIGAKLYGEDITITFFVKPAFKFNPDK